MISNGDNYLHSLTGTLPIFIRHMENNMDNALLSLTHEQQQEAVEEIQKLAQQGMSMGEAIQLVANQLREKYKQSNSENSE